MKIHVTTQIPAGKLPFTDREMELNILENNHLQRYTI